MKSCIEANYTPCKDNTMADVSNGTGTNDQFQSTLDNVDEMFTKLSIPEIQRLSSQYSTIIATTKNELHNLVSDKYRDLIKIAEDIGDLRNNSLTIEEKLQEISYKPSTFVSPYKDSYAKFESIVRDQNATKAKQNSRTVIVRNVIQKRLAKLANKISREGPSPILHTSNFIPFVKELYTIEVVFGDVLKEKKDLQQQVHSIKYHLLDYFEHEISVYNFPLTLFNSNDKFSLRQRFLAKDFLTDRNAKFVDDISFIEEDFDEFQDDDDAEEDGTDDIQVKQERFDKLDTFKNTNYNRNVLALCNYLVCYTILLSGTSNSKDIKQKLIDLRMKYINSLLALSSQNTPINYRLVFLYLENTCTYLRSYFGDNRDSDYFRTLRDIAKPWSLVELVGHRGWIDDSQVDFGEFLDTDGEYLEVNPNSSNKIVEFISRLASISSQSTETPPTMDFLTSSIVKYYTFIMSLKRLDDATKFVGVQSQLIDLVSKTKLLDELSANLESLIKEIYDNHVSKLMNNEGILGAVQDVLDSAVSDSVTHNPFDVDVVNVMDYNLGEYMKLVINKGDNTNKAPYNTTYQLKQWLNESFQLKKITDFNRDFSEMLRGKKDIYDYLPQLYHSLRSDGVQWGDFTGDSLKKRFQTLSTSVNQSFNQEISKFSTSLFELSSEEREVSKLIYLIGLLTSLRNEIKSKIAATNSDTGALMTAVDSNIDSIFKKVVSHVLDGEVYNLRQLIIAKESQANEVDIPTRPNIQLALKMYEVAQAFLTQASKIEPHNVDLFLNSSLVPSQFIKVKNEWFEKLIEVIVFQINSSMNESDKADVKEEEAGATTCDTGTESKASKDANLNDNAVDEAKQNEASDFNRDANESQTYILQTAANIAFLKLFYKPKINAEDIKSVIDALYNNKNAEKFNENMLEIIASGISSFYKTRKNVYLPLL